MSESQPGASTGASTSDLGVVDPIRIPGVERALRLWAGLPRLAQVFVVLVGVDIVIRALGLFQTSLFLELGSPVTWITAFVPHDALILLPAVILARRPDAPATMPLIVRGAITIALVELLEDPLRGLLPFTAGDGELLRILLIGLVVSLATAAGWVTMARGIEAFTPRTPFDSTRLLANLVGGALALAAVFFAVSALLSPNFDMGNGLETLLVRLTSTIGALGGLGFAYFAWVIVRGTDGATRPATATRLASISVSGLAVGTVLSLVAGGGIVWTLIFLVTIVGGYLGLVVSFGLGLADPSGTIEHAVPTDEPARQPASA